MFSIIGTRKPEYLFKISCDEYIYVDYDHDGEYEEYFNRFRLFKGKKNKMIQQEIKCVLRLKDGGSTLIKAKKLILHSPFIRREAFPTIIEEPSLVDIVLKLEDVEFDLLLWSGRGIVKLNIERSMEIIKNLNLITLEECHE